MHLPGWHLQTASADLNLGCLSAKVVLAQPDRGLVDFRVDGRELPGLQALGPHCGDSGAWPDDSLECYQRGADLVAAFRPSSWPVRVDTLWRAAAGATASGVRGVVDLVISVHTDLLEIRPELAVRSLIPAIEGLRLTGGAGATSPPSWQAAAMPLVAEPGAGPGCLLFRLPDVELSYAEMVHPADFQQSDVRRAEGTASIEVLHRLFAVRLEKGVILRARVRGIFVDRANDIGRVLDCYREFAEAEPPLGT
jgi:hypothetical protein